MKTGKTIGLKTKRGLPNRSSLDHSSYRAGKGEKMELLEALWGSFLIILSFVCGGVILFIALLQVILKLNKE